MDIGDADLLCSFINFMRPLQNLHSLNFHPYILNRMNIFDQKMPLEGSFE